MSRPITAAIAALLVAGALAASACGSSTSTESGTGAGGTQPATTAKASDYKIVPDAAVTAGLADVKRLAGQVPPALASNPATAKERVTAMYDAWFAVEGTVRKNDKNDYLDMEDGLALIKTGADQNNADKVTKGIAAFEKAANDYLAAHPG